MTEKMKKKPALHRASVRDKAAGITAKRSPKWPKVEKAHLAVQPTCAACGSAKKLNVHHKKPFHLHPELELDPANLVTLCMDNECHILLGHGDNFKAYNPEVERDVARVAGDFSLLEEVAAEAKAARLFE